MREIICENVDITDLTIDNIHERMADNHFVETVCKGLNHTDDNVVIWGTYNNAVRLRDYLVRRGIANIKACVVNRRYLQKGVNEVCVRDDFPQYSLEDWLEVNDETTIVIDFSFYSPDLLYGYEKKIKDVYVGDLMGMIILEEPYIISKRQIEEQKEKIQFTYDHLSDEQSKKEFLTYILQKNVGFYGKEYHKGPQYFDRELITPHKDEVLVDCGAFVGDTIGDFIEFCDNSFSHIFSFEMDKHNYEKLIKSYGSDSRITNFNKGVGEKNMTLQATLGINSASRVSENGADKVDIVSIDEELGNQQYVSFIKMDIEGFEMEALKGAKDIIRKYKPTLAVCMYHKFSDLTDILELILEYYSEYKFFFRNYHNSASECVLYAIAD